MNRYEVMYLISPKIKDEDLNPLTEQLRTLISKHEGKVAEEEDLGKKKLAYPIKHFRHGFYYVMYFDMPGAKLSALEADLKMTDDVLRYLIVKHDAKTLNAMAEQKKRKQEREMEKESELKEEKVEKETKPAAKPEPVKPETKPEKPVAEKETVEKTAKPKEKETRKAEEKKEKAKLDELDKKLDEILDDEIID